jgi:hypothetical protein
MSTRPTIAVPHWSTAGSNIEPSAGKKSEGWIVNERPPAEWLNWLQNSAGEWLQFLADATAGQPVADLLLNFANTDAFAALIDVTTTPASSNYRLVARFKINSTMHVRIYAGSTSRRLLLAYNAVWGGSSWLADNNTQPATAVALVNDGTTATFELLYHAATPSTWTDAAWSPGVFTTLNVQAIHAVGPGASQFDAGITSTSDITAATMRVTTGPLTLKSTTDIAYATVGDTQPRRNVCIPMSSAFDMRRYLDPAVSPPTYVAYYDPNVDCWRGQVVASPAGTTYPLLFPVSLPRGALRWSVRMMWHTPGTHFNQATLYRVHRDFGLSTLTPPVPEPLDVFVQTAADITAVGDANVNEFDVQTDPVDPAKYAYFVSVIVVPSPTGNVLYSLRSWFDDPGARNG